MFPWLSRDSLTAASVSTCHSLNLWDNTEAADFFFAEPLAKALKEALALITWLGVDNGLAIVSLNWLPLPVNNLAIGLLVPGAALLTVRPGPNSKFLVKRADLICWGKKRIVMSLTGVLALKSLIPIGWLILSHWEKPFVYGDKLGARFATSKSIFLRELTILFITNRPAKPVPG